MKNKAKHRYQNLPVSILTARNITNELNNLKNPPFSAIGVDSKLQTSFKTYTGKIKNYLDNM